MTLVMRSDFYGPHAWNTGIGDMPAQVDVDLLTMLMTTESEAQKVAQDARRSILAQMAFLGWFCPIQAGWERDLSENEAEFVRSLRLDSRPKRGFLFKLTRDYQEANFYHLLMHDVPVHYVYSNEEKSSGRFVRYSPEFWEEYMELRREVGGNGAMDLSALPSYELWKTDLERYDMFFQDKHVGRPGGILRNPRADFEYYIVDFLYYGARPVENWHILRAYSERFKAKLGGIARGTSCIFFRQNPIRKDEPAADRERPNERRFALTDFASVALDAPITRTMES
jgi:hypothetical protein